MKDMSEKFMEYINGSLHHDEEQKLFQALTYDDDLRLEFRSFVAIDRAMKNSAMSMMPSAATTNAIFSGLGLSISPSAEPVPAPVKLPFFRTHWFTGMASGLVSAIATVLIVTAVFLPKTSQYRAPLSGNEIIPRQSMETSGIEDKETVQRSYADISRPVIRNAFKPEVNVDNQENMALYTIESSKRNSVLLAASYPGAKKPLLKNESHVFNEEFRGPNYQPALSAISKERSRKDIGLSLEVRNSAAWNFPEETISPSRWAKLNNTGASLLYEYLDNSFVGIDIRQETFFLQYTDEGNPRIKVSYDQQPNLTSYGIFMRMNTPVTNNLAFAGQFGVSFNSYGTILRPMFGLTYSAYDNFSFIIDAEFSGMVFQHNQKTFTATKLGFNYGIIYKF
jgi:hypothetical protein